MCVCVCVCERERERERERYLVFDFFKVKIGERLLYKEGASEREETEGESPVV